MDRKNPPFPIPESVDFGNCYVIQDQDQWIGILLYNISYTVENTRYDFLVFSPPYSSQISLDTLRQGHIRGHSGPANSKDLFKPFEEIKDFKFLGYSSISVLDGTIEALLAQFHLLGQLPIEPSELRIGSYTSVPNLEQFLDGIQDILGDNRRGEFDNMKYGAFPIQDLLRDGGPYPGEPQFTWTIHPKNAHPKARELFTEEYFWSTSDELAPFGSDEGFDAFFTLKKWLEENPGKEPARVFLEYYQMDEAFLNTLAKDLNPDYYEDEGLHSYGEDYIMAIVLGQLLLQGKISNRLKEYGKNSMSRQKAFYTKSSEKEYPYRQVKLKRLEDYSKILEQL